jgi:hypothetical protein
LEKIVNSIEFQGVLQGIYVDRKVELIIIKTEATLEYFWLKTFC